ncbi:hypothetical protein EYF80_045863 [Liparis tanakae]|uniref:Uncharacterized protein n=1 Tax=Liparis tanakae TaxID=230148 RepID=A0A4Z2FS08_9TELE|nr:hypothetical protein EYF80_045863 [Liparis tanakae]
MDDDDEEEKGRSRPGWRRSFQRHEKTNAIRSLGLLMILLAYTLRTTCKVITRQKEHLRITTTNEANNTDIQ